VTTRRWISPRECCELLSLSLTTVYAKIYAKQIPSTRLGRTIRIDLKKLEEQLEKAEKP
jgi:excisionase family DNA binding protein